jgi:alkylation response protein AidB-like acyl-CoA dehydrogenase
MFMESMTTFTTEEQKKEWLPKVMNIDIIGTYA